MGSEMCIRDSSSIAPSSEKCAATPSPARLASTAPVLIFGAGAVEASLAGLGVAAHFSLLGAMLLLALFLAPLAAAAALRIALE